MTTAKDGRGTTTLPHANGKYPDSIAKTMWQLAVVAKEPITYGKLTFTPPPAGFTVTPAFWRTFGCYLGCGGCCSSFTLDFLADEYAVFAQKYPHHADDVTPRLVTINERTVLVSSVMQERAQLAHDKSWCQYHDLTTGACTVHEANPFSCRVELMKFRRVKDTGWVFKGPYGRAWAMKRIDGTRGNLACTFEDAFSPTQFWENDIPVLRTLQTWAEAFGVATYLPELIDALTQAVTAGRTPPIHFGGDAQERLF